MSAEPEAGQHTRPVVAPSVATLGATIRELRRGQDLTLEALGKRSGVSTGLLSQIERGQGNPSFSTLVQIAHALGVPVTHLMAFDATASPVVRENDRRELTLHTSDQELCRTQLLTPSLNGRLEVLWIETQPGYSSEETPFSHDGEEFGLVLEGPHEVWLDGQRHRLETGDAITYSSRMPHWYRNPTDHPTRCLWVITPPTF